MFTAQFDLREFPFDSQTLQVDLRIPRLAKQGITDVELDHSKGVRLESSFPEVRRLDAARAGQSRNACGALRMLDHTRSRPRSIARHDRR